MTGYSKRSLVDKLGLKAGMVMVTIDPPDHYQVLIQPIPSNVMINSGATSVDFVHLFVTQHEVLETEFERAKALMKMTAMLWISWPKGSSKISTDLNENVIREIGLKHGLVDVKVCAVDEDWSGLKFVYRLTDRH